MAKLEKVVFKGTILTTKSRTFARALDSLVKRYSNGISNLEFEDALFVHTKRVENGK